MTHVSLFASAFEGMVADPKHPLLVLDENGSIAYRASSEALRDALAMLAAFAVGVAGMGKDDRASERVNALVAALERSPQQPLAQETLAVIDLIRAQVREGLEAASALPALVEAIEVARATFLDYAALHDAKGSPEAALKAERNRALAEQMGRALVAAGVRA